MKKNPAERQLQALEGADTVDQIHYWTRLYRESEFEPRSPRIPINEFYSLIMHRYSGWLIRQFLFVVIFALVAGAMGFGIKHGLDHRHAQNVLIEEEQEQISQLTGGFEDGTWWVELLRTYNHGVWGPQENPLIFTGLELHSYFPNLQNIEKANNAANRVFNRWPTRTGLALVGLISLLFFARSLTRLIRGISAVKRLNDIMLAEDAKA